MTNTCPNCGGMPMGEGCYHICHNSTHYYSPEQERYDDQFYGDDDQRERYAATTEPSQYITDEADYESFIDPLDEYTEAVFPSPPDLSIDPDDIPF